MNWVVDGTRLKNDFKRFEKILGNVSIATILTPIRLANQSNMKVGDIIVVHRAEDILPKSCLNSYVPVVFDFKGLNQIDNPTDIRHSILLITSYKWNTKIRNSSSYSSFCR